MCPTLLARLQTRLATLALPALVACAWGLATRDAAWPAFVGLMLVCGAALDACVYRPLVRWQPAWLGAAMAVFEWAFVVGVTEMLGFPRGGVATSLAYWAAWAAAQAVRVALLPVLFVTRLEEGGELGRSRWWIPDGQRALAAPPGDGEALPDRLSSVWARPAHDDGPLRAPSHIAPIPPEFLAVLNPTRPPDP